MTSKNTINGNVIDMLNKYDVLNNTNITAIELSVVFKIVKIIYAKNNVTVKTVYDAVDVITKNKLWNLSKSASDSSMDYGDLCNMAYSLIHKYKDYDIEDYIVSYVTGKTPQGLIKPRHIMDIALYAMTVEDFIDKYSFDTYVSLSSLYLDI